MLPKSVEENGNRQLEKLSEVIAQKGSESTETAGYVDDLVLLVRRLVHRLNQCSPTDPLVNKALDYLRRNGHQSSQLK